MKKSSDGDREEAGRFNQAVAGLTSAKAWKKAVKSHVYAVA